LENAVCGFREKCLAWIGKNNIVHALPRLAEEEFAARAAFLFPDDKGLNLILLDAND
jgi:hypothetical protein